MNRFTKKLRKKEEIKDSTVSPGGKMKSPNFITVKLEPSANKHTSFTHPVTNDETKLDLMHQCE